MGRVVGDRSEDGWGVIEIIDAGAREVKCIEAND
jgi:hypothetical protein